MKTRILRQHILLLLILFCSNILIAQVGVKTTKPAGVFHIDAKGNNTAAVVGTDDIVVDSQGRVGIGMLPTASTPPYNSRLQINGGITLKDGTQNAGKVLISDNAGVASWGEVSAYTQTASFPVGITIPYKTTGYLQSGLSVSIPPGRYAINISLIFRTNPIVDLALNSGMLVRYTFSDSNAASGATASADLEKTTHMIADVVEGTRTGFSVGTFIVKNSTSSNKNYYLIAGNITARNISSGGLECAADYFLENGIVIYKLSD